MESSCAETSIIGIKLHNTGKYTIKKVMKFNPTAIIAASEQGKGTRMNPVRLFNDHPASVGENYGQHLIHASGFGFRMMLGGQETWSSSIY